MENFIELCVSVFLTFLFSPVVSEIVEHAGKPIERVPPPEEGIEDEWLKAIKIQSVGKYVGAIERLVFLSAYWLKAYTIVVAYLGFKWAVKWETWKNIVQVPASFSHKKNPSAQSKLSELRARNAWGTHVMERFIVGTFSNLIAALMAGYLGHNFFEILEFIKCTCGA